MNTYHYRLSSVLLFVVLSGASFIACQDRHTLDEKTKSELLAKGEQIKTKLSGAILAKLTAEIQANGPAAAIRYCSVNALPMTDSISKEEQVTISRISHKNRNPKNVADSTELVLIQNYMGQLSGGTKPASAIMVRNEHPVFYSPIVISTNTCLKCHGKPYVDIDSQVVAMLTELYPGDKAQNFEMGQLRGLFKVEFDR